MQTPLAQPVGTWGLGKLPLHLTHQALGRSHDLGVGRKRRPGVMPAASVRLRCLPDFLSGMRVGRCQHPVGRSCLPTCAQKGSGDVFTQELSSSGSGNVILNNNSNKGNLSLFAAPSRKTGDIGCDGHVSVCAHLCVCVCVCVLGVLEWKLRRGI